MLYLLGQQFDFPGALNLIRYLSFRAGAASATGSRWTAKRRC